MKLEYVLKMTEEGLKKYYEAASVYMGIGLGATEFTYITLGEAVAQKAAKPIPKHWEIVEHTHRVVG